MNVLIIGAGAIGTLVGAKLALAGHNVTLVGRPRFAAAVADRGLLLIDERGRHPIRDAVPVISVEQAFSIADQYDFSVLAVKSYDTQEAIQQLAQATHGRRLPVVVSLQNGVGNEETIADVLGPASVIAGILTTPVSSSAPATIQVQKPAYCMGLSPWHPAVSSVAYGAARAALQEAGFSVTLYADACSMKWTKLLMNTMANAACAILDLTPEEIFADTGLANLEIQAWRETLAVMRASAIPPVNIGSYPFGLLAPLIRTMPLPVLRRVLRKSVGGARGGKMPSLHIDLERGRSQSEVSWLNGATARKGKEVRVATPINRMLTDVLLHLAGNPSARLGWRHNRDRLIMAAAEYQSGQTARIM